MLSHRLKMDEDILLIEAESELMDIDVEDLCENKCSNYVYVDVQGFRSSRNRFICKEFCLVDGEFIYHKFIKSPYSFNKLPEYYRRQANWLMKRYHGIKYEYGDTNIIEVKHDMFAEIANKTILVKGIQKISWLKYMFRDCGEIQCLNIEDLENFDLSLIKKDPYDVCHYHNEIFGWGNGPCAMTNALIIQDLSNKNSHILNSI